MSTARLRRTLTRSGEVAGAAFCPGRLSSGGGDDDDDDDDESNRVGCCTDSAAAGGFAESQHG